MSSSSVRKRFSDAFSDTLSRTRPKIWLDTGNEAVNASLGDPNLGIPTSRIQEIYSVESAGKTSLGFKLLALAQQAGGVAVYGDTENTYDELWAAQQGVKTDELIVLGLEERVTAKKKVYHESLEDFFEKIDTLARLIAEEVPDKPSLIVWDSIAGTPTRAELDGEYDASFMAPLARGLSKGFRKLLPAIRLSPVSLICMNQMRMNIGGFINTMDTPGGRALNYYASVRSRISKKPGRNKAGIVCEIHNVKNKMAPPFRVGHMKIQFDKGVSWIKKRKKK